MFYARFRPMAQKLFFVPALILIVCIAVNDWYENRGEWEFINTAVVSEEVSEEVSVQEDTRASKSWNQSVTMAVHTDREAGTDGGTTQPTISNPAFSVIQKVGEEEGVNWKILMAICLKESNCRNDRIGDSGHSLGAFQIHTLYHPAVKKDQAVDLEWSARWTAKRLKRYAHLGEAEMIRSHNGLVPNQANAYYVKDIYKIIETL